MKTFLTILLAICLSWVPRLAYAAGGGSGLNLSFEGLVWALIYLIIAACIICFIIYSLSL